MVAKPKVKFQELSQNIRRYSACGEPEFVLTRLSEEDLAYLETCPAQ
jgi:hypothetical protein